MTGKLAKKKNESVDAETGTHTVSEKKEGKRKATPTLDLTEVSPAAKTSPDGSQCEIIVVYAPSLPQTNVPEMKSPNLPPGFLISSHHLSNMSWSLAEVSAPAGPISAHHNIEAPSQQKQEHQHADVAHLTIKHGVPILTGAEYYRSGELPDIHALPGMPALWSARMPCRGYGRVHPAGHRYSDAEMEANLTRFALFRHSKEA